MLQYYWWPLAISRPLLICGRTNSIVIGHSVRTNSSLSLQLCWKWPVELWKWLVKVLFCRDVLATKVKALFCTLCSPQCAKPMTLRPSLYSSLVFPNSFVLELLQSWFCKHCSMYLVGVSMYAFVLCFELVGGVEWPVFICRKQPSPPLHLSIDQTGHWSSCTLQFTNLGQAVGELFVKGWAFQVGWVDMTLRYGHSWLNCLLSPLDFSLTLAIERLRADYIVVMEPHLPSGPWGYIL